MYDLIRVGTVELTRFLSAELPKLSAEWWQRLVVDRLSFHQQRSVQEKKHNSLQQLDFAALLRVLDQNWNELCDRLNLPREGRSWVKELQTVRNKWAHLAANSMPAGETYRDTDTLGRLLAMIGSSPASLEAVGREKGDTAPY